MAEGSTRGGRSTAGPLVLAVIFLAVLGAGAGFSLGTLARDGHTTATSSSGPPPTGSDRTPVSTPPATDGTPSASASAVRCLAHTEQQAGAAPLIQLLYLHTKESEVWICRSTDGTLYYQGHKGQPGGTLTEGSTALFLNTVEREGGNGYVATNTSPADGHVTKYHVTSQRLIIEDTVTGDREIQPAV